VAGRVVGLVLHWPCVTVTDLVVYPPRRHGQRKEGEHPVYAPVKGCGTIWHNLPLLVLRLAADNRETDVILSSPLSSSRQLNSCLFYDAFRDQLTYRMLSANYSDWWRPTFTLDLLNGDDRTRSRFIGCRSIDRRSTTTRRGRHWERRTERVSQWNWQVRDRVYLARRPDAISSRDWPLWRQRLFVFWMLTDDDIACWQCKL